MHADRPGDRPRILYWYRTAPGIVLGRAALDEDAIRTIEDQHPEIEFDWPAILALSEVMTPEDEAPPPQSTAGRSASARRKSREPRRDGYEAKPAVAVESASARGASGEVRRDDRDQDLDVAVEQSAHPPGPAELPELPEPKNRLVEELAGREIAGRLRARHADILARIEALEADGSVKDALFKRAEPLDPELWMTPESVLDGVRNADTLFEQLRAAIDQASRE